MRNYKGYYIGFRPLTGDLSSLLLPESVKFWSESVSVPLQGTYLPYTQMVYPLENLFQKVSVPLQGTYLPYRNCMTLYRVTEMFPSPYRGLIFLTLSITSFVTSCFRPLTGDLSSLPRPCNTRVSVCFHCTLRGKKKISLSSSFFSCSTSAKWPIPGHRGKFL